MNSNVYIQPGHGPITIANDIDIDQCQCCSYGTQSAVGTNNDNDIDNGVRGFLGTLSLDTGRTMAMSIKQDLLDELDSFDPRWRDNYATLQTAAMAAGCWKLYMQFVNSHDGRILERIKQTETDWNAVNERSKAQVAAEIDMANKGNSRG